MGLEKRIIDSEDLAVQRLVRGPHPAVTVCMIDDIREIVLVFLPGLPFSDAARHLALGLQDLFSPAAAHQLPCDLVRTAGGDLPDLFLGFLQGQRAVYITVRDLPERVGDRRHGKFGNIESAGIDLLADRFQFRRAFAGDERHAVLQPFRSCVIHHNSF